MHLLKNIVEIDLDLSGFYMERILRISLKQSYNTLFNAHFKHVLKVSVTLTENTNI